MEHSENGKEAHVTGLEDKRSRGAEGSWGASRAGPGRCGEESWYLSREPVELSTTVHLNRRPCPRGRGDPPSHTERPAAAVPVPSFQAKRRWGKRRHREGGSHRHLPPERQHLLLPRWLLFQTRLQLPALWFPRLRCGPFPPCTHGNAMNGPAEPRSLG